MKKLLAICCCCILLVGIFPRVEAVEQKEILHTEEIFLDGGIRVVSTVSVAVQNRSSNHTAYYDKSFYDGEILAGYIRFEPPSVMTVPPSRWFPRL